MRSNTCNKDLIKIITVLVLIVVMTSALVINIAYAKFADAIDNDYTIDASDFYFSSNILSADGGATAFSGEFNINLFNFELLQISSYNITYSISVTDVQTSGNSTVSISDDKSGTLAGGTATTATVTVTPHADVLSFKITVATTNGYATTLSKHFGKEYTVTLDKDGGTGGSNTVTAINNYDMPEATAPTNSGYFFAGYYSGTDGQGTQYYNAAMESTSNYNLQTSTTLYAYWDTINPFAGGQGTLPDPFQIETWTQLNNVRDYLSGYFVLNNDLDSTDTGYNTYAGNTANAGLGWEPIGNNSIGRFTGHFDGQGYTISNLFINRATDNVGLFGHVGISAANQPTTIKNICLSAVNITGKRGTGALIGRVTGNSLTLIQYACVTSGQVTGTGATGGLIGSHNSYQPTGSVDRNPRLLYSYANVSVSGIKDISDLRIFEKIGGLVGCSQKGSVINCYSHSSVYADNGVDRVGGLAGCNIDRGILQNSYSSGTVTVGTGTNIGGLIGRTSTDGGHIPVTNSYWDYQSSGMPLGSGIGSSVDTGVTGLTTLQMQDTNASTYMSSFDFVTVWQTVTDDYPILRAP